MSEYKTKILLGIVMALIITGGLAAATFLISSSNPSTTATTSQQLLGAPSTLIVQLTDPPVVPAGTVWLNLTYTSINLLVAEPNIGTTTVTSTSTGTTTTATVTETSTTTSGDLVTTNTVTVVPSGGSAMVDLLQLQNIAQTLASASLPYGSTIYSVSLTVSSINIDVGGVTSAVTLSTGSTLTVALVKPSTIEGTSAVLLELNPTIVDTSTGYQMIASSIGVIKPQGEITHDDDKVGNSDHLSDQDQNALNDAKGQITANLVALSTIGSTTTIEVQVSNTGSTPVQLTAIGIQGDFTGQNPSGTTTTSSTSETTTSTTVTSTISTTSSTTGHHEGDGTSGQNHEQGCDQTSNELVLIPFAATSETTTSETTISATTGSTSTSTSSTSTTSCSSVPLNVVNSGGDYENGDHQLTIGPGQCLDLTYAGTISFGHSNYALTPSTLSGQTYLVHVIASHGAEMKLSCVLPLSTSSCTIVNPNYGQS